MQQNVLESHLTREERLALKNRRAGMLIFQISWIMAFVCMVVVNWQMRFSSQWMPPGTETSDVYLATFATAALGLSVFLVHRALQHIRSEATNAFLTEWAGAMALGVLFVAIMIYEWIVIETGTQYAQVFRLMTGFHVFHAVVIGGYLGLVYRATRRGEYDRLDFWTIEAGVKLWDFVLIAWMLFYVVIYWV